MALTALGDGLVTVLGSAAAAKWLGLAAVPLGSIAGVALVGLPMNLGALRREVREPLGTILRRLVPWLWRCLLVSSAGYAVAQWLRPTSWPQLLAMGTVAGLAYALVMAPVVLRSPASLYMVPRLEALARPLRGVARRLGLGPQP